MAVDATPGFDLQPSATQIPTATNYITDFNFLNQYLPDTYEKEFERYGNRTIASFLRLVGAEMPSNSDLIKWAEQGRLHTKYTNVGLAPLVAAANATFQVNDNLTPAGSTAGALGSPSIAIRIGQTVMVVKNDGSGSNKGIVTAVPTANTFTVALYEAAGFTGG